LLLAAVCAQADTMVQWGAPGGENIVSNHINCGGTTTYDPNTPINPAMGAQGYYITDSANRTPTIYGADNCSFELRNGGTDFAWLARNFSATGQVIKAMLVWQDQDFMTERTATVTNFSLNIWGDADHLAYTNRWLVEKSGQFYISQETFGVFSGDVDASTLSWYEYTPMSSGSDTIGDPASISLDGLDSVGFYVHATATNGLSWRRPAFNYFAVQGEMDGVQNTAATLNHPNYTMNASYRAPSDTFDAYVYWGDDTNNWANSSLVGSYTNVASTNLSYTVNGLDGETTYYYRYMVTNAVTNIWSTGAESFYVSPLTQLDYGYKMQITFTNFAARGTLTNFPALVKFNTSDNFYAGFTSAEAHDLRFTESDGTTVLNYEIEKWNTNGESFVWVQVTNFTDDCSIWAYWGRADATQPAYTTNGSTWDSNFRGVWHLSDTNATGKLPDSTGNPNAGVNNGTVNVENEVIGDAQLFTDNYINCGTDPSLDLTSALTVSAWGYFENNDNSGFVYAGGGWSTAGYGLHVYGGNLRAELRDGGSATGVDNPKPTEDQWTHVTLTWDNIDQTIRVYYDGVLQGNTDTRTAVNPIGTNFKIGNANSGNFEGMIDEVRAEAVARSTNWIWACYQNQGANHNTFVEYGAVTEIVPIGTLITIK